MHSRGWTIRARNSHINLCALVAVVNFNKYMCNEMNRDDLIGSRSDRAKKSHGSTLAKEIK